MTGKWVDGTVLAQDDKCDIKTDMTHQPLLIAIDGTAASGKGTLARILAEKLDLACLDTGKLYRYVGWQVLQSGGDPGDARAAIQTAKTMKDHLKLSLLSNPALQSDEAGQAASKVGAVPEVRAALLDFQKDFAVNPPLLAGGKAAKGAILDGRDIGTVVCPQADVKLFIDANIEIRAQRRMKELQSKGLSVTYEAVLEDMRQRDARDADRPAAPMKPAQDAAVLDTGRMTIEEVVETALTIIRSKTGIHI